MFPLQRGNISIYGLCSPQQELSWYLCLNGPSMLTWALTTFYTSKPKFQLGYCNSKDHSPHSFGFLLRLKLLDDANHSNVMSPTSTALNAVPGRCFRSHCFSLSLSPSISTEDLTSNFFFKERKAILNMLWPDLSMHLHLYS